VTISHFLTSLAQQNAERFARLVRGHWGGCEIRNHWVRDTQFKEDASHLSWPAIFELTSSKSSIPYDMVCNSTFK
jgi:hypothetical protein